MTISGAPRQDETTVNINMEEEGAAAPESTRKERPVWMMESTVITEDADAEEAAGDAEAAGGGEDRAGRDDIMSVLLQHETRESKRPVVPGQESSDDSEPEVIAQTTAKRESTVTRHTVTRYTVTRHTVTRHTVTRDTHTSHCHTAHSHGTQSHDILAYDTLSQDTLSKLTGRHSSHSSFFACFPYGHPARFGPRMPTCRVPGCPSNRPPLSVPLSVPL